MELVEGKEKGMENSRYVEGNPLHFLSLIEVSAQMYDPNRT